jgi:hypothetical protein
VKIQPQWVVTAGKQTNKQTNKQTPVGYNPASVSFVAKGCIYRSVGHKVDWLATARLL